MRFHTKMITIYAAFILLVGGLISLGYYSYSAGQYRKTVEQNLRVAAQQVVNQIDEMIKPMETRTLYILSDAQILESIRLLSHAKQYAIADAYLNNARDIIQKGLNIDYVMNDFYRVILFNPVGDVISSRTPPPLATKTVAALEDMPWLAVADAAKGRPVLITAHEDTWGVQSRPEVFSLLRAIQGSNMGYIEVQRTIESVADTVALPKEGLEVAVFVNSGELLYANGSGQNAGNYWAAFLGAEENAVLEVAQAGTSMLSAASRSSAYDVVAVVADSMVSVQAGSNSLASIAAGIAAIFCIISLGYVIVAAHFLTSPLRKLREVMENTQLGNLEQEIQMAMPNDELKALNLSYQNLLERLHQSIVKEKQASLLHLQAQFDLLQAQVNPHFLYNVLNVITQHGMQVEDEEICDICASLASVLRYSTNTKQRYATIAQELQYLEQYFYLLKSRYKHKLSFTIAVDAGIHGQFIPKIALQQVVENCINHGLANSTHDMRVTIEGWRQENRWTIRIRDNGQGFDAEKLQEIIARLTTVKTRMAQDRSTVELEIGGMGLVNTYARLYLLFGESLEFVLSNHENGAEVRISAACKEAGAYEIPGDDRG